MEIDLEKEKAKRLRKVLIFVTASILSLLVLFFVAPALDWIASAFIGTFAMIALLVSVMGSLLGLAYYRDIKKVNSLDEFRQQEKKGNKVSLQFSILLTVTMFVIIIVIVSLNLKDGEALSDAIFAAFFPIILFLAGLVGALKSYYDSKNQ